MSKALREAFVNGAVWWGRYCKCRCGPNISESEADSRYPDSPCATVREIVVQWLKDNGKDGLCSPYCTGCAINEGGRNFPAHCFGLYCRPGVLVAGKIVERK